MYTIELCLRGDEMLGLALDPSADPAVQAAENRALIGACPRLLLEGPDNVDLALLKRARERSCNGFNSHGG